MRSCELIYEYYLTAKERELLGDQSHGIMRNLTKYRNRRSASGFALSIEDFNRVISKLKAQGVFNSNVKKISNPSYDLVCHILYQVYSRTAAPMAHALNNYERN